jgi:hypothetical protein
MIKYFLFLIISFNFLESETFQERQNTLQDIKNIVQYEESFARIYEQYILDNYKLPPNVSAITSLMGGTITSFVTNINSEVNGTTLTVGLPKINYALGDILKTDSGIKSLYESDTFRKRTYVQDNAVYFILEDSFAKHLFDLIKLNSGNEIQDCSSSNSNKACKRDNHIYIDATGVTSTTINSYLMSYHVDKFKTGPIVVTNDSTKFTTEEVFKSIPKGALIYDIDGVKYIKTTTTIEALK